MTPGICAISSASRPIRLPQLAASLSSSGFQASLAAAFGRSSSSLAGEYSQLREIPGNPVIPGNPASRGRLDCAEGLKFLAIRRRYSWMFIGTPLNASLVGEWAEAGGTVPLTRPECDVMRLLPLLAPFGTPFREGLFVGGPVATKVYVAYRTKCPHISN